MGNENRFDELNLDSVSVARALRWAAKKAGLQINMTQIMKLLYITYGFMLVSDRVRITQEHPRFWPYGPAFPRVNKHVRLFDEITSIEYDNITKYYPSLAETIDEVVGRFGKYTAAQLSAWSHQEGSPWDLAGKRSGGKWNYPLSDDDIYDYFFNFVRAK